MWTDREIPVGQEDWESQIQTALNNASVYLVVISANAMASAWQNVELGMVLAATIREPQKRVIPVLLPGTNPSEMHPFLRTRHAIEFDPEHGERAIDMIAKAAALAA